MSKITGQDIVNSAKVNAYLVAIEKDSAAAVKLAEKVLKSSTAKLYSNMAFNTYVADLNRLVAAQGDFLAAWNLVSHKRANSPKEIIRTYSKYVDALEVLEASNARHAAMMTSGFALMAAALSDAMIKWTNTLPGKCKKLEKDLGELLKLVKRAQKDVSGAEWQRALNLLVSAVSLCLAPVTLGGSLAVAAGGVVVHSAIDAALGPSRGSVGGTLNTVAGEAVGIGDAMGKASGKLAGGFSAIGTLKMDTDEVALAEKILREVKKRLQKIQADYDQTAKLAIKQAAEIGKHQAQFAKALKVYESSARKFKSQRRRREGALKEFKQWK